MYSLSHTALMTRPNTHTMYHDYTERFSPIATSSDLLPLASPPLPAANRSSPFPDQFTTNGFPSISEALAVLKSNGGDSSFSRPSSLPTYLHRPGSIPKSSSSHSHTNVNSRQPLSPLEIFVLQAGSVRRVSSTGDLEGTNGLQHSLASESPLGNESCSIIDGVTKVGRYSAEERRERIERYRSKRNQRNFHKKIKYACRKTLADSRPRVRGRFARNEEMGESSRNQWGQPGGDDDEDDEDVWITFLDAFSANLIP